MQEMFQISEQLNIQCPVCFETIPVTVDTSAGLRQAFEYDCEVCCNPMLIRTVLHNDGEHSVLVERES